MAEGKLSPSKKTNYTRDFFQYQIHLIINRINILYLYGINYVLDKNQNDTDQTNLNRVIILLVYLS